MGISAMGGVFTAHLKYLKINKGTTKVLPNQPTINYGTRIRRTF